MQENEDLRFAAYWLKLPLIFRTFWTDDKWIAILLGLKKNDVLPPKHCLRRVTRVCPKNAKYSQR